MPCDQEKHEHALGLRHQTPSWKFSMPHRDHDAANCVQSEAGQAAAQGQNIGASSLSSSNDGVKVTPIGGATVTHTMDNSCKPFILTVGLHGEG